VNFRLDRKELASYYATMYINIVISRNPPPAALLRKAPRENSELNNRQAPAGGDTPVATGGRVSE